MRRTLIAPLFAGFTVVSAALPAQAALDIQIAYSGPAQYQADFEAAASTWESLITGWQNGIVQQSGSSGYLVGTQVQQIFINASVQFIDGSGGILGGAGPETTFTDQLGFRLAASGSMVFDSADVAFLASNNLFKPVVLHEVAHVLGFGTLWTDNGVYVDGSGEYTGLAATALWRSEFGQTGTPDVELEFGPGTANAHWNEDNTIFDRQGRSLQNELMTGFLDANPYISQMTVASFADIGYVTAPIPEPATYALFGLGVLAVAARVRRKT